MKNPMAIGRCKALSSLVVPGLILALVAGVWAAEESPKDVETELKKLSLEELMELKVGTVYGASKHEQKTTEAPSAVSIVTADEIQKYGHRTLADILNSVRGFYVTYDRGYNFAGLRGVNRPGDFGGRILLMVDGHRMNDAIFDSAAVGTDFILDTDMIDRVEIIRGPGSSLYGNNAFFAVINVITRTGRELNGAEVSGAAASFDTYSGRLSYGNRFSNGVELALSGTYYDSAGHDRLFFPEFSAVNNGVAEHLDGSRFYKALATLSYRDFSLEGAFSDRKKDLPTGAYGTEFNIAPNNVTDERAFVELKYQHQFGEDLEVKGRVYYDHYSYLGVAPYYYTNLPPGTITINRDMAHLESAGGEGQISKSLWEKLRLTSGLEYRRDFRLEQKNQDVSPPFTYFDSKPTADMVGVYAQGEWAMLKNLILNAGLRYDYFSSFGDTWNPRAGVIYSPWTNTTFKFLYGQAFRAPNAYELYYQAPGYLTNPNLRPERIRSYELVYEQTLSPHLSFSSSLFYNQIKDLITQVAVSADTVRFDNTDAVDARGVEVELNGQWARGLRGRASYAFTDAIDDSTGQILNNSPRHLAKLNLSVPLYLEKVFASAELQAMSRRQTVAGNSVAGFWTANFTLFSRELIKGLEVSASVYNLFDRRYADPVSPDFTQDSIQQDGRTFRVKLTYRF